jgi:hypothetical protein
MAGSPATSDAERRSCVPFCRDDERLAERVHAHGVGSAADHGFCRFKVDARQVKRLAFDQSFCS